jgi:hypothetical protein
MAKKKNPAPQKKITKVGKAKLPAKKAAKSTSKTKVANNSSIGLKKNKRSTVTPKFGKKMVDGFLLKVSPQLQKQMDNLKATVDKTPASMADLKVLGLRILERAKLLSQTLRAEAIARKKIK